MLTADYDEFEEYRARAFSASSGRRPQPMPEELRPRTTSMPAKPLSGGRQKKLKSSSRSSSGYESGISSPVDGRSRRTSDTSKESVHYVLIVGVSGVGKTSLIDSFKAICSMEEDEQKNIKVTFNGKREEIVFVEEANVGEVSDLDKFSVILTIYTPNDKQSFLQAYSTMKSVRNEFPQLPIICAANKRDLVRNRVIPERKGKEAAQKFQAKHAEVSALLSLKITDLLTAVVQQCHLSGKRDRLNVLGRLFGCKMFKSCENLNLSS